MQDDTIIIVGGRDGDVGGTAEIVGSRLSLYLTFSNKNIKQIPDVNCEWFTDGGLFHLRNNGYGTCAIAYPHGFTMIGGKNDRGRHGKVDRCKYFKSFALI